MENGIYKQLIKTFMKYKGIGYASLEYTNKQGERSKRLMNLGAKLENAKKSDIELLNANGVSYVPHVKYVQGDWDLAMVEQKKSLVSPDENRSNGQINAYTILNDSNGSVRFNHNKQEVYLFGKSERKEVLIKGVYPTVNSSAKTLAKNEIKKSLLSSKFRTLLIKNVKGTVKVNKQTINIEGEDLDTDIIDIVLE